MLVMAQDAVLSRFTYGFYFKNSTVFYMVSAKVKRSVLSPLRPYLMPVQDYPTQSWVCKRVSRKGC